MDPNANLEQQLEIAHAYADGDIEMGADTAARLSELIVSLHEWIVAGGFPPEVWPISPRALALNRLISDRRPGVEGTVVDVQINGPDSFMLADYWVVTFADGFQCGIAPDGSVSS